MNTAQLQKANVLIKHDMTPPEGARPTGELHLGTYPVYVRATERSRCVPVKDDEGEVLFHRHPQTGVVTGKPVTRLETWEEDEEFILMPLGNGQTEIVTTFRPSEDEQSRREAAVANAPDKLAVRLAKIERAFEALGVNPDEVLAQLDEPVEEELTPKGKK